MPYSLIFKILIPVCPDGSSGSPVNAALTSLSVRPDPSVNSGVNAAFSSRCAHPELVEGLSAPLIFIYNTFNFYIFFINTFFIMCALILQQVQNERGI